MTPGARLAFLMLGIGAIAALAICLHPVFASAMLPGALFVPGGAERALAVVGLGLACASTGRRAATVTLASLSLGMVSASILADTALWPLLTATTVFRHLHLLPGPSACLLTGLALVLPRNRRTLPVALLAGLSGLALGLAAVFNDPGSESGAFAAGAGLCLLVLVTGLSLAVRAVRRPWFAIPERIAGSWLVAIGLMLGGASFVRPHSPELPLVAPPAVSSPPVFIPPGAEPLMPQVPGVPFDGRGGENRGTF